ncbi:hypothetical protein ACIPWF_20350 [Paenarthrobacter sp. NPDC089989]|uniref:hypothetical protein n=1 Tax=unclassified Paenarthrobacter TaxID=2634190 RepID=UPI00380F63C5
MSKKTDGVARPGKSTDYVLEFITREAEKGWQDARATARNALTDAWDYLTNTPGLEQPGLCYILRGRFQSLTYQGSEYARYQYKFTHSGRIWYAVVKPAKKGKGSGRVLIERVEVGHPNETEPGRNFR